MKNVVNIHNEIVLNHREQSYIICRKICATGDQLMKQLSQPHKKINIVIFSHLWFLELKQQYKNYIHIHDMNEVNLPGEQRGLMSWGGGWEKRVKG